MTFAYLIYSSAEWNGNQALQKELEHLFLQIAQAGVTVRDAGTEDMLLFLQRQKILPESVLVLTCRDAVLAQLKKRKEIPLAVAAYQNPAYPGQSLFDAAYLLEGFAEADFDLLERIWQRKHGIPWRVAETKRCCIREMTLQDLDELYEMYREPSITAYMEPLFERQKEEEYTKAYIESMYAYYGYGMWLVRDRHTNELIGRAGLGHYEMDGETILEMGYAVAVPYQRQGYATEICAAVLDYAKAAAPGFEKIYCYVQEKNQASLTLLDKLGFSFYGTRKRNQKQMLVFQKNIL